MICQWPVCKPKSETVHTRSRAESLIFSPTVPFRRQCRIDMSFCGMCVPASFPIGCHVMSRPISTICTAMCLHLMSRVFTIIHGFVFLLSELTRPKLPDQNNAKTIPKHRPAGRRLCGGRSQDNGEGGTTEVRPCPLAARGHWLNQGLRSR